MEDDIRTRRGEETVGGASEQRLRLALESGWLGAWDLDLDTNEYVDITDIWLAQFGHPDPPPRTQADFLRLVHPDDRPHVLAAAQEALANRSDYVAEYRNVWADGSVHWISAQGRLMCNVAGQPRRMVGVTRDITEERARACAREQELAEAQERADRDPLTGLLNHRAFQRRLEEETQRAQREGTTLAVAMLDLDGFKFFNDTHGHVVGDEVLCLTAQRLRQVCRPYDTLARFGGDEFGLLLPGIGTVSEVELEARLREDMAGLAFRPAGEASAVPVSLSVGVSLLAHGQADRQAALQQADARLRRAKAGADAESESDQVRLSALTEVAGFSMLDALVTAVDNKDRYTRRHSEDVLTYSLLITDALGLDAAEQHMVGVAALLHDVGKIGVPDAVLRKPGALTEAEMAAVRLHPTMGAALVSTVPGLEDTLDAVRYHHERWDGRGYPAGLRGEETPLIARLMAVADAYSAMTTDRPYRTSLGVAEAQAILEAGAGAQWDPRCVEAFLGVVGNARAVG